MTCLQPVTSGDQLRGAFACFPSGVTAICVLVDGVPNGMAASSFTSVSVSPALVSVCIQNASSTWPKIRDRRRLGISVLAEGQDDICLRLSRKNGDRFAGIGWQAGAYGSVFIPGASAWLDCSLYEELEAGDHTIALLEILELSTAPESLPLVYYGSRFRRLAGI